MPDRSAPRFSCADFTFPLLPHDKLLQLLRLLDFSAVDIGVFADRSHLQPRDILPDVAGAARRLNASLEAHGLVASDIFLQTGAEPSVRAVNDPDPKVRQQNREMFRGILEFAREVGCRHMTGLPGVAQSGMSDSDALKLAAEESAWRAEQAEDAEVVYAVEPHLGSICPDPQTTVEYLERCEGVTLTLDYGHFICQGMTSSDVHPLVPHASHFHARGAAKGQLQAPSTDNAIDFDAALRLLKQNGYGGYLCLEYVWVDWQGCNRTDNVSETLLMRDRLSRTWSSICLHE